MILYGIKSCDTVKKARKYLEQQQWKHDFHDFRSDGLEADLVASWLAKVGHKVLLNTRSTTWRTLDDSDKADMDNEKAKALILAHPTLIKRPVLAAGNHILVGFKAADYDRWITQYGQ
ncbi:ArsC family reductase [Ferrimonas gelatinilytica]|uniref:ArsC family reductase n=1 Tax=Ferrimonas gelatinilytica TaxID=1255257 RepID=A0ABP9S1B1_9GAMM